MSIKFGQHFLIDPDVLQTMVELVRQHGSHTTILEIGPGKGILTQELVQLAPRVIAIEIDRQFEPTLERLRARHPHFEFMLADILKVNLPQLGLRDNQYSVAANLPYEITSIVLRNFLSQPPYPSHMALLIQREVAERLIAPPGQLSILGLSVQVFCQPRIVHYVPASAFQPQPKVESAIVSLEHIRQHVPFRTATQETIFFRIIKTGFAQKRKLLISNLSAIHHGGHTSGHDNSHSLSKQVLTRIWSELNLPTTARAQELSVEQWLQLVDKLEKFIV